MQSKSERKDIYSVVLANETRVRGEIYADQTGLAWFQLGILNLRNIRRGVAEGR
jgi:hypothetical protein